MAAVSIAVPGPLGDPIADILLALLGVKAEVLHLDAEAHLRHGGPTAPLLAHLAELRSVGDLLAQLGPPGGARAAESTLTGPRPLVREVLESAVVARLDRLVPSGGQDLASDRLAALAEELDVVRGLVGLLRQLDAARPPDG